MSLDSVLGQQRAAGWFRSAVARDRLAHALLLTGPDGSGKTLLAIEFAKAILCQSAAAPHGDECSECRAVTSRSHPDFLFLEAQEGRRFITIEQIRDMSQAFSRRPVRSSRRVAVVRDAERLNEEASNALLKTLEEPPSYAVIFLTTARPKSLLETIRSRCQEIRCSPLPAPVVAEILGKRVECPEHETHLAARVASGSVAEAIAIIESGCLAFYLSLRDKLLRIPKTDPFDVAEEILEWLRSQASQREVQREHLRQILRLGALTYRDMLAHVVGCDASSLLTDAAGPHDETARRLGANRLMQIVEAFWTARRQTDQNADIDLVLRHLVTRVAGLQA